MLFHSPIYLILFLPLVLIFYFKLNKFFKIDNKIILGLFEIGYADHDLSNPELRYIKKVSQIFGIDQQTFNRLRNSRPEFNKEDPYKVLGAKKSQSTTENRGLYPTYIVSRLTN